jgi:signal transduction histidine kinase
MIDGGEMGARMRAHGWAGTPLGAPAAWPQSLKTLVGLMLASTQPMFMAWGREMTWLYNDAFIPILGKKHPGALGRPALAEVWSEAHEVLAPLFERVFAGEAVHMGDFALMLDRHGRLDEAHFSFSYTPARDESGAVAGLFGVCTEITEQVLAERRRAAEQQRQRRIFEQAPSFMCILEGPEHVFAFANRAHRALFNSGGWIGRPIREAFPYIAGEGYIDRLDEVYTTGRRYVAASAPVRYRREPDAPMEERLLDFIYEPILDDAGCVTGVFCEGFDVTEARRAEQALRESEAQLRFLDALGEATRATTEAAATLEVTTRMLGEHLEAGRCAYADVEADGDTFTIRNDWTDGAPSSAGMYRLAAFGSRAVAELHAGRPLIVHDVDRELRPEDGADMFNRIGIKAIVCYPHVLAGRLLAMMAVHHAAPRRWTEREVALIGSVVERSWAHVERIRSQEKLIEADRRKDNFLATLAHELRNPLAPIRQAVWVAKSPQATEVQRQWARAVIERQANHMALLLDDLLDVSRITRGQLQLRKEWVDLAAVVDAGVETARPLIDSREHTLRLDLPAGPVRIEADALRLSQVVSNLLTNAAKYTDARGRIELSAGVADGRVRIAVRDSGMGIDPQMLPRVFEMFSQAASALERAEGGLGIGLALVKGIVELHGGTIEARSAGLGRGSEFVVSLPFQASAAGVAGSAVPAVDRAQPVPKRIVVADDNRDAADSLKLLLEIDGHQVSVAQDGDQALQAASAAPDVMFIDIGMPKLNGYEVARRIRAQPWGKRIKLVAVTGWGQDQDRDQALQAGFDRHLTKPVDHAALQAML